MLKKALIWVLAVTMALLAVDCNKPADVEEKPYEGEQTDELAGWFMTVEIPQEILSQANYFSAG